MQHSIRIHLFLLGLTAFQIHTLSGTDWFDKEVLWRLESDNMFRVYDPKPILNKIFCVSSLALPQECQALLDLFFCEIIYSFGAGDTFLNTLSLFFILLVHSEHRQKKIYKTSHILCSHVVRRLKVLHPIKSKKIVIHKSRSTRIMNEY